jgi:hypothetical protein
VIKESERAKELVTQGLTANQVIEMLIHEDFFPDTEQSRKLLRPIINELIYQRNNKEVQQ